MPISHPLKNRAVGLAGQADVFGAALQGRKDSIGDGEPTHATGEEDRRIAGQCR